MKALVIGGNRFFGKRLVRKLVTLGSEVTVLNRGSKLSEFNAEWGERVKTLVCDRTDSRALKKATEGKSWDVVFDQACYDADQASLACEVFNKKTPRYIFTSSQSVYGDGASLRETNFDAKNHQFTTIARADADYGEAKRQAEATFAQRAPFSVVSVRFPIVLGEDDYTGRLKFHIERIKNEKPIYFPNIGARLSFVHSQDAADVLFALGKSGFSGALNVASAEPIRLQKLIQILESALQKKAVLTDKESPEEHSPFGITSDWWMEISRLSALGIYTKPIEQWLPSLLVK